jgi:hypothetical protein
MKMIGFFDSLVYLIFYGGAGGNAPARGAGILFEVKA